MTDQPATDPPVADQLVIGTQSPVPDSDEHVDESHELPSKLTFRITPVTLMVVLVIAVCVTPVAWTTPPLLVIYVIPLALLVWVLRNKTIVDTEKITARTVLRKRRIPWDEVKSFKLDRRRWVRVVLHSSAAPEQEKGFVLPTVRVRDLPHIAVMSGGRLPDITADPAETDPATRDEDAEGGPTDVDPGETVPAEDKSGD